MIQTGCGVGVGITGVLRTHCFILSCLVALLYCGRYGRLGRWKTTPVLTLFSG